MSSTQVTSEGSTEAPTAGTVDMKLEVLVLPVSDVDRAKSFYEMFSTSMRRAPRSSTAAST